ncbi:hypothetical protein H113_07986 [Trichophyton rubrum MR1459]|uniref:Uncharacterized protein n=1 Tax=Trichophyton rubrum (strain ATCC MYA-4607 / CBS 118892) TaxID=559305 RepID=F2SBP2_TRIRC|nr:uncharacterized protein TERG_00503 [Trichophyton rubrum CBS 118892]EGD84222.2 hypothetical protein TERG_00503 [Trichophyton rubrum CBS 118892]EZF80401.1 hypothetical protein H110_07923 [Trichophyton rubrum MR1448]EZF91024.1 hypothetical protein H113_07986 [Trichophyton rubrum MR1459]
MSHTGHIKIGDIRTSMLLHRNEKNLDIQAIGYMVREIIKPGNSKLYPRKFSLKDPSKWNSDMLDFFK